MTSMAEMLSPAEEAVLSDIGSEYCVNYSYLNGTKKELAPIIKRLKELEYIAFHRGLMAEDEDFPGGYRACGAGWVRTPKGNKYVEEFEL